MMKKTITLSALTLFCITLLAAVPAHAFQLLSKKEALTTIFGEEAKFAVQTKTLQGETLERVKERLGGKLVDYQEGSESAQVASQKEVTFYFAIRNGKKIGVALIDVEPGKWGPVEFIIAMDFKPTVRVVKVMSYQEKRGRPIARSSYMQQYEGKTTADPLEVGRDITGISGATISSRSATFAVKKALVLFEELYLKK